MNKQKYARTMEEAFGPYARGGLWVEPEPMSTADKIIAAAVLVGAIGGAIVVVLR